MGVLWISYALAPLIAGTIAFAVALYAWRHSRIPSAAAFAVMSLGASVWSLGYVFEILSPGLEAKIAWDNFQSLGRVVIAPAFLVFALFYTRRGQWGNWRSWIWLIIEPIVTGLLAFTDSWHGLIRVNPHLDLNGPFPTLVYHFGGWSWVSTLYGYVLASVGMFFLAKYLVLASGLSRYQTRIVLLGIGMPYVGGLLTVFGLLPPHIPNLDISPLTVAIGFSIMAWGAFRYHLLDIVPTAHAAVVESMSDGVLVLDAEDRVVDLNPAARRMIGPAAVLGRRAETVFAEVPDLVARYRDMPEAQAEIRLDGDTPRHFDLRISPLRDRHGHLTGRVVVLRDISERKQAEARLRMLSQAVEQSQISVLITDPHGNIEYVNPKFVQLTGYSAEEVLGKNPRLLKSGETPPEVYAHLWKTITSGREWQGVFHNKKKNGEMYWEEAFISPILDEDGKITQFLGVQEDITQRKQVEETVRRQNQYLNALHQITLDLLNRRDLNDLLQTIVDRAAELLDAPYGCVALAEDDLLVSRAIAPRDMPYPDPTLRDGESSSPVVRVFESRQPFVTENYSAQPGIRLQTAALGMRAAILLPVLAGETCLGVLTVARDRPGHLFSKEDVHTGRLLAELAALVVENTRLLTETRQHEAELARSNALIAELHEQLKARRVEEQAALYATTRDLAAQHELPELLRTIVERAKTLLGVSGGGVYLYDAARGELELTIVEGMSNAPRGLRLRLGEGVAGIVATTRQPLIVDEYHTWVGRSSEVEGLEPSAVLQAPMLYSGELIGVLVVNEAGDSGRAFNDSDAQLLSLFATQAASAVHNARLLDAAHRRAKQLELLYDAGLVLNRTLDPRMQLEHLIQTAAQALRADCAEFFRYHESSRQLCFEIGIGFEEKSLRARCSSQFDVGESHGAVGWVAANRAPLNIPDVQAEPRFVSVDPQIRSGVWVPIQHENQLLGIVSVLSKCLYNFSAQDERLLSLFANQAAVAMLNTRLFEQLVDSRERMKNLSMQLWQAQETERRHLARELHDEIGQVLTTVKVNLQTLKLEPGASVPQIDESMKAIDHAVGHVRDISLDLHPSVLDDFGLVAALEWYVNRTAGPAGISAEFKAELLNARLPTEIETACYRVVQEALTNVVRHARAERVSVQLFTDRLGLHLEIRDNGIGFDVHAAVSQAAQGESLGILGMQERVHLVGGEMEIESAPLRGCVVRAHFPLNFPAVLERRSKRRRANDDSGVACR